MDGVIVPVSSAAMVSLNCAYVIQSGCCYWVDDDMSVDFCLWRPIFKWVTIHTECNTKKSYVWWLRKKHRFIC